MFWGLNLKANRKYTQTTSKSFHISQAALDSSSSQGGATQIFLTHEEQKFLICTLRKDTCEQATLDLNFAEGDEVSFQSQGSGNVTLSGYLIENDPSFLDGLEEEEEESATEEIEDDLRAKINKKLKKKSKPETSAAADAKSGADEGEDEDDSDVEMEGDDSDDDDDDDDDNDEDGGEEVDEDDEEEGDDDDGESDAEDVVPPKKSKLEKPQNQANGVAKPVVEKKKNKDKKDKKEAQQKQNNQKAGGEKVLSGGVKIEDIRVGNGPEANAGKRVTVYYEGRLKSNNKVFDSLKQGAGFKFRIGRGEVIKGWEIGLVGMKLGGRRRITCPPNMGYGARGSPPTIPPNSTLVFDVELKAVN